jgi:exopolysaccharide biosynthesis predicted pyruvyltransferase EpsI
VRCYNTIARYFDGPIVVGPQSCLFENTDVSSIFSEVSNETHFFCREEYSRDLLTEELCGTDVQIYCDHDTALYLDREDLPISSFGADYTLAAFRADKESAEPMIDEQLSPPIVINDISVDTDTYEDFVNVGAQAETIYTDRLHGAILGSLLEKPVRFYENAYHKNWGVYEYSLEDIDQVTLVYNDAETAEQYTHTGEALPSVD